MDRHREEFKNPGIHYRSKPFWAWNGKLSETELCRQLDILKEMGFGGAFIHSRVGLETEYMGKKWMQLVDRCLAYGKEIGLEVWIYDEDRWPSGTAGGIVTKKEKNRTQRIQMQILTKDEADLILKDGKHKEKERIIAAFQCHLEGHCYRNLSPYPDRETENAGSKQEGNQTQRNKAYAANGPEQNAAKQNVVGQNDEKMDTSPKVLLFSICASAPSDNYNGYTYLDTMNKEAVEDFLDATQSRYETELSKENISCLQGFFTDEPHRGAYLCDFSEGNVQSIPYTDGLFDQFKNRYGYELIENLPSLFLREEGQSCSRVSLDYLELTQELFLKSYMEPYKERCHQYGHLFTGHLLHEDSLSTQTCMMGSLMTGYEYMDIPGIDLLGERTDCWWIGKQLSSVAHQMGKKQMLSELYGCTGWQMKLEDYKAVGDWQAMMGINLFCPHLCWYTMKGENKRDYPASIFYQSAWYKEYAHLEDYFARVHMCTEGTPADCRLLVLNPIRSVWARTYSGCFNWLLSNDPGIDRIEKQYEETFRLLMEAGIDFDYGEERILQHYGRVEDGRLIIGECAYDKVLLSGAETIEETTWALLMELVKQGGRVITAGEEPTMIRAGKDARISELMALSEQIPFHREELVRAVRPAAPLYSLDNHGRPVYMQAYKTDNGIFFIILNMDREHPAEDVELRIHKEGSLEEWNARNGEVYSLEASGNSKAQEVSFSLAPGEEKIIHLIFFTQEVTRETADDLTDNQSVEPEDKLNEKLKEGAIEKSKEKPKEKQKEGDNIQTAQKAFCYRCKEPNIAVLDRAEVYLEGQLLVKGKEILQEDRILRDKLGLAYRGGEMMQPWYIEKHKPQVLRERKKLSVEFSFYVPDPEQMPGEMDLAAEYSKGAREETKVFLNGRQLYPGDGFWIDPAFQKFHIKRELLEKGKNEISLEYLYGHDSGLEAVYLLGDFGVDLIPLENTDVKLSAQQSDGDGNLEPKRGSSVQQVYLKPKPEKLTGASITKQGFPFYSGSMIYELDEETKRKCRGESEVEFSDLPAALAILHGEKEERILYAPYRAKVKDLDSIEMIFGRRNTFGPLHLPTEYKGNYGPETFLTENEAWRDEMQLISQGLPQVITFRKEC